MPDMILGLALGVIIGLLVGVVYFLIWKAKHTSAIRQDAVLRSQAVTVGKVTEQLVPLLPGFTFNPKDVRFLGSPVDLVVFDGLCDGELLEVVFVEVKTGTAGLSGRERQVRDAILEKRVRWDELRLTRGS
jgi:predicted Holliday junction resolvase-like endonuclease